MPLAQEVLGRELTASDWIRAVAIVGAAVAIAVLARRGATRSLTRVGADQAVAQIVGRVLSFLLVVFGLIYALALLEIRISPLLGALGIGGVVLGLALQDILSNLVSGVLLQVRRPFKKGDQIVTNDYEGTVEGINLRVVQLTTFDGDSVYVPNSMVLQNPITNWTRTPNRRTTLQVGVAYDTDLAEAQRVLIGSLGQLEEVEKKPAPEAFVYEFGDSSINFAVHFWHGAKIKQMWRARDAAAQAIKRGLDEAGITIPFPQRTLWFGPGNTELALRRNEEGKGAQ